MKYEIKNRWSGEVQFVADISCPEDAPTSIKLGLSLKWGYESGAVLRGAVLRDADLTDAVLTGAVLRGAVLTDPNFYASDEAAMADLRACAAEQVTP